MHCAQLHTSVPDDPGHHLTTTEEWVFHSLDHRRVDDDANSWLISVVGVHVEDDGIWVQIAKNDRADTMVLVQMQRDTDPADVIASLKRAHVESRVVVVSASRSSH